MPYETRPGQGALFVNDKKTAEKQPDRRGTLICPCCRAELWLSGWGKKSKAGNPWLSLEAQQKSAGEAPGAARESSAEFDDDIPF